MAEKFIDLVSKEYVEPIENDVTDIKTADYGAGVNLHYEKIQIGSISGDGTPTPSSVYPAAITTQQRSEKPVLLKAGKYDISSTNMDMVYIGEYTGADASAATWSGAFLDWTSLPVTIELTSDKYFIFVLKKSDDSDVTSLSATIMVKSSAITDNTYYPYIKTNQRLQEDVAVLPENAKKNYFSTDIIKGGIPYDTGVIGTSETAQERFRCTPEAIYLKKGNYTFSVSKYIDTIQYIQILRYTTTTESADTFIGEVYDSNLPRVAMPFDYYIKEDGYYGFNLFSLDGEILPDSVGIDINFMIRPAGTSPDYVPYMRSNLELTHDTDGVRGVGRNLLKNTAVSQTMNGITYTVNDDMSITANGTATADSYIYIPCNLPLNNYIYSGSPDNGSDTTYGVNVGYGSTWYTEEHGEEISVTAAITRFAIIIRNGCTANNLTFKPMIRSTKYADDPTYYPYSENEIEFQSKVRPITVGTMYDADSVAAVHNAHPRGKDITDIFNAGELSGMISSGLFDEIYLGDYFTLPMEAVTDRWSARTFICRVMHINPMKYVGDSSYIADNHIGFATDESWFDCPWNESGTTDGGYVDSTIHKRINEEAIVTAWQSALSGKLTLMQARMLLSNAINKDVDSTEYPGQKGMASNWIWNTNYFKLMSEMERYGAPVWSSGKGYNTGSANYQLAYYANNVALRGNKRRTWEWLSDIVSVSGAAYASSYGVVNPSAVARADAVRPLGFLKS